ncbi:MAG: hypothetical protein DRP78_01995 [Candidatus Omnitrophota bacterium]|nr:MAG: hypothetical protein DRP78_01995 [Candidatus Omnitrophota bacterium]
MRKHININVVYVAAIVIIVTFFCLPLFRHITWLSDNDEWFSAYAFNHFSRMCVLKFHQLPLRSHFLGGGVPIIGHTYQGFVNPFFVFVLIFGEIVGLKIITFLIYLAGAIGMYYLTRMCFKFHVMAAFFSALFFTLSGYLPSFLNDGNYFHIYIFLLPLALALFLKAGSSIKKIKYLTLCSLVMGIILLQSGFFFIVAIGMILLISLLKSIMFNLEDAAIKIDCRYLQLFFIMIVVTLLICAVKLIPMFDFIESRVAPVHSAYEDNYSLISETAIKMGSALSWKGLYSSLFIRQSKDIFPAYYLGVVPVMFALFGFIFNPIKNLRWVVVFTVFLFLSMGPLAPIDLFKLLWSTHSYFHFIWKYNKYFSIGIIFSLSILGGSFISYVLQKKFRKRWLKGLVVTVLLVLSLSALIDLFQTNIYFHKNIFTKPPFILKEKDNFFQVYLKGIPGRDPVCKCQYFYLLHNAGLINWHSNILLKESALPKYYGTISNWKDFNCMEINPEYKGEFFFVKQKNKVECDLFSPNRMELAVEVKEPDFLVINQNFDQRWQVRAGKIHNYHGLLSVKVDKFGKYKVVLSYVPIDFWVGLSISIMSLVCLITLVIRDEIKR